jgi:hypothetical protein
MTHNAHKYRSARNDREVLDELTEKTLRNPHWVQIGALRALGKVLETFRDTFDEPGSVMKCFNAPTIEGRFPIEVSPVFPNGNWFDIAHEQMMQDTYETPSHLRDRLVTYVEWFTRTKSLWVLTLEAFSIVNKTGVSRFPPPHRSMEMLRMSDLEEESVRHELFRPIYISGMVMAAPDAERDAECWRETARRNPHWTTQVTLDGHLVPVSLLATVDSLVVDRTCNEAYFALRLSLTCPRNRLTELGQWHDKALVSIWEQIQNHLAERISGLMAFPIGPHMDPTTTVIPDSAVANTATFNVAALSQIVQDEIKPLITKMTALDTGVRNLTEFINVSVAAKTIQMCTPRLSFPKGSNHVLLDGKEVLLTESQREFLKGLHDAYPNFVGQHARKAMKVRLHVARLIDKMPPDIQSLIDRKPGAGCRLKAK